MGSWELGLKTRVMIYHGQHQGLEAELYHSKSCLLLEAPYFSNVFAR